ncbi:hypothetical protein E1N66_10395 [Pantoea allii]|nr:hypothetical protein [Pantoea allii]THB84433.1 hypothetical protein E1N66_10395 [Pantoea allii]
MTKKKADSQKDESMNWLEDMNSFTELSQNTTFAVNGKSYWQYKYEDVSVEDSGALSRVSCGFKITKEDNPTLVGVRIPEELIEKIKSLSHDAFGSVLLALADAKATELLEDKKRIIVSNTKK